MAAVLAAAGFVLVCLPVVAHRGGRRLPPDEWVWVCGAALVGGALAVEAGALLYAMPTVAAAARVPAIAALCERMFGSFAPGGAIAGWSAAAVAVALPGGALVGAARVTRTRRRAIIRGDIGARTSHGGYDLVVLPLDRPVALSIPGRRPQILVTDGLRALLDPDALDAVLGHEVAHLRLHHGRFLVLAAMLDVAFVGLPPVRASTTALRAALERAADEAAATDCAGGRESVRRALFAVAGTAAGTGVVAFSEAGTILERIDALGDPAPKPSALQHAVVYAPLVGLLLACAAALGASVGNAQMLIAMANHCT